MSQKDGSELEIQLLGQVLRIKKTSEFDPMELEICKPKIVKVWSYSKMKSVYRSIHRDTFGTVRQTEVEEAQNA